MKHKFVILSLLLLTYIITLGHEVVLGHHLSHDTECYHHNLCDTEEHQDEGNHLPCLLDLSPHFISTTPDLISDFDVNEPIQHVLLFNSMLNALEFKIDCLHSPECQTDCELSSSPDIRSHSLRGPPVV